MPSDSRLENSVKNAEDELSLIKNQIQQTLLDIREHVLDSTNPFVLPAFPGLEEGAGGSVDATEGADGAAGSEGATGEGESEEEVSEDAVVEEGEGIGEPGLEEEEIVESELGSPGDEEVVVDSIEDPGEDEAHFEDFEDEEQEPLEEEFPEDALEEEEELGEDGEDADDDESETTQASRPEPLDIISLASLVRWVAATLERVGRARLEVLLDAYEQSGRMSPEVKTVARTLCELADEDPYSRIPVRDIVGAMMRLEGVLGHDDGQDNRLLSLIFQDEYEPADSLVASLGLGAEAA